MENNNSKIVEKKTYVTPEVIIHGDIEVITQSTNSGPNFDGQFDHLFTS